MQATPTSEELFIPITDPIYSISDNPVAVDTSTDYRGSVVVPAQLGGQGTPAAPLNGNETQFIVSNSSNSRLRLGTSGLRIGVVFTADNNSAATVPVNVSPPWNLLGHLISEISIEANQHGSIVAYNNSQFAHVFTGNCLRDYSKQKLDDAPFTFGPLDGDGDHYIRAIDAAALNFEANNNSGAIARRRRWMTNPNNVDAGAEAGSHLVIKWRFLPLNLILGCADQIVPEIQSLRIKIRWNSSTNLLERTRLEAANFGAVNIVACDFVADQYIMSPTSTISQVQEKAKGNRNIVPYMHADVHTQQYTPGSSILISNVSNLHSVFIYQPANGLNNGRAVVDNHRRTYTSLGQFAFFGNSPIAVDDVIPSRADSSGAFAAGGISSVQVQYNGIYYPQNPINTQQTVNAANSCDFGRLWLEYQKAISKFARREVNGAIGERLMGGTMPFIFFKLWSDNGIHLNSAHDLRIDLQGGVASTIIIVLFRVGVVDFSAGQMRLHN